MEAAAEQGQELGCRAAVAPDLAEVAVELELVRLVEAAAALDQPAGAQQKDHS